MINVLEYKGYFGTVEYSANDDVLFGKVMGVDSLISFEGDSLKGLREDFENAIDDYLEICAADGLTPEAPYMGNLSVQVSPELHKTLAIYSTSHGQTLNFTVEEAIKRHISG
ncbi:MAG: type II toxin-antitoxin system HicB family antitoxin [Clostridiales bacterium]|nr:type II toxin-antitoxin system HicB family antitoxin [Clostridiales bacterium]